MEPAARDVRLFGNVPTIFGDLRCPLQSRPRARQRARSWSAQLLARRAGLRNSDGCFQGSDGARRHAGDGPRRIPRRSRQMPARPRVGSLLHMGARTRRVKPIAWSPLSRSCPPIRSKARKSLVRNALFVGAAGAATIAGVQIGCSSPGADTGGDPVAAEPNGDPSDGLGQIGTELTLPGGEQINSVTWTVTGPNGASTVVQSGTVNVANSTTIQFLIGGIPAGANYLISLSGTSADGTVTCAGSATFSTTARATTNVSVALQCNSEAPETGSALVTANTFNCAHGDVGLRVARGGHRGQPSRSLGLRDRSQSGCPHLSVVCAERHLRHAERAVGELHVRGGRRERGHADVDREPTASCPMAGCDRPRARLPCR